MAVKKKKKVIAYDPYRPYGGHSLKWYQQQADSRAAADTNAAVGALPSSQFYTDSATQLANALKGIRGDQAGVAAAGGEMYANAFKQASEPANRAAMVAGGQPVAGPANTGLVGALGATMAQAFSGGEQAAVARGRNDVIARAGQEAAIRAKQASLSNSYLEKMKEDALQARVAQFNQQIAESQFGLQASDTAFDNNLAAANLAADTSNASASAASKAKANNAKNRAKKLAGIEKRIEAWLKPVDKVTGYTYTFQMPGLPSFQVTGKDGTSGLQAALAKLNAQGVRNKAGKPLTGSEVGAFLKSTKPISSKVSQKSKSDVYRIALRQLSGEGGVMTKAEARRWLRDYFGVSQTGPFRG